MARLVPFTALLASTAALRVCVVSKIIVDSVAGGPPRLGGGGVQAAVGVQLGARGRGLCRLTAPVGMDFDSSLLIELSRRGVDSSAVSPLPEVKRTPGEVIRYEGEKMRWESVGWESWDTLCAWVPPLDAADVDAFHVIVEGGGDGEVRAVLDAVARQPPEAVAPFISVEPVMHEVSAASIGGLARLTAIADVVSPDFLTAARIAASAADAATDEEGGLAEQPLAVDDSVNDSVRSVDGMPRATEALLAIARGCARALALRPSAWLAIRDGADGSYLYRHAVSSADAAWIRVPAVPVEVSDPTGAGNGYAGALCAQLASGAPPAAAAAVASAVGSAFCRTAEWAPLLDDAEWCFRAATAANAIEKQ